MIRLYVSSKSFRNVIKKLGKKRKINYFHWFNWWITSLIRTYFPIVYLFEMEAKDLDNVGEN